MKASYLSVPAYDYCAADAQFHWNFHQKEEYNELKFLAKNKISSKSI